MNIEQAMDSIKCRYVEYQNRHDFGDTPIDPWLSLQVSEYEAIKSHIESQQEEIDCMDRNAGDANDLIHKQCLENDKLKSHIEAQDKKIEVHKADIKSMAEIIRNQSKKIAEL